MMSNKTNPSKIQNKYIVLYAKNYSPFILSSDKPYILR